MFQQSSPQRQLNIAVFGDVHGHLRLMFQLARLWQLAHGSFLDGILACGDLGYFPDLSVLDKATRRYVRDDPEEAGFARFFLWPEPLERDPLMDKILLGPAGEPNTVRCPVIWCHGNHEDFIALEKATGSAVLRAVDVYHRLFWLRSGHVITHAGLRLAALGGGPELAENEAPPPREHPLKRVREKDCWRLAGESVDILMSHVAPLGLGGEAGQWGSGLVRDAVERLQPRFHFFAHHRQPVPAGVIGRTRCYWLNDVAFDRHARGLDQPLEKGCLGVLTWPDPKRAQFTVIEEDWLRGVTSRGWRWL